jgi:hypothetical protein
MKCICSKKNKEDLSSDGFGVYTASKDVGLCHSDALASAQVSGVVGSTKKTCSFVKDCRRVHDRSCCTRLSEHRLLCTFHDGGILGATGLDTSSPVTLKTSPYLMGCCC